MDIPEDGGYFINGTTGYLYSDKENFKSTLIKLKSYGKEVMILYFVIFQRQTKINKSNYVIICIFKVFNNFEFYFCICFSFNKVICILYLLCQQRPCH